MSYLHDATPTWNGFNYQGKIALYVVLDKLIDLNNNGVNDYSLELEWFEDFAIKRNNDYLSIHQVKNYGNDRLNDYKNAIQSLLLKSLRIVTQEELKSVIKKRKNVDKDAPLVLLNDLKASGIVNQDNTLNINADINALTLTNGYEEYSPRIKSKITQLKQIATFSQNLTNCYLHIAEQLTDVFDSASISALDTVLHYNVNNGFNEAISKIKLYQYSNGVTNCNNDSIIDLINTKIKLYLTTIRLIQIDSPILHNDNINKIRHKLINVIDKNISDRHQAIRNNNQTLIQNISFTDFTNILNSDEEIANEYYHSFHLKETFNDTLEKTLKINIANDEKCKNLLELADYIFNNYSTSNFKDFCLMIRPHANPKDMHGLISTDALKQSFFKFFMQYLKCDDGIYVRDAENKYSLITAILETEYDENIEKDIYDTIMNNQKILPPLTFNIETLVGNIGSGNGGRKLSDVIPKATTAGEEYKDAKNSARISISEDFKIVDITDEINRLTPP